MDMPKGLCPANRFGLNEEFRGDVWIEGLPDELAQVPKGPTGPSDSLRFERRAEWEHWALLIRNYRNRILTETTLDIEFEKIEQRKCANDPAYFVAMYGYLYEPRKNKGRGGYNPWIPFERQVQMIRWFQCCMASDDENADGILSKCRDVGASWMMCALFLWAWRFTFPFNGLMVSLKEDAVDSKRPKSLFWKIDRLLEFMPAYLKPNGFSPQRNRQKLFLENPENGNVIGGESTTSNSGRADRATAALFDEAAQIPSFMDTWMSTADSTEHRFGVSTESMDEGPDFSDLARGVDVEYHPSYFPIDWHEHPLHDDEWYEKQEKRYAADPDAFRREILRDPYTQSHFVYPPMREKFPLPDLMYIPGNPLYVGIDPGFDDNCAIVWIQYNVAEARYEVLNGYTNRLLITDYYGPLLSGSYMTIPIQNADNKMEVFDLREQFQYGSYEEEMIEWVASIDGAKAKFIGDLYGEHKNGASADTWYSVWKRNHGITVNRDRTPAGKSSAAKMQARTLEGRRKALRWIIPNLVFADTIGARRALLALQNNTFAAPSMKGRISESGMLRDGTTHFTSALEYWAANMYMQDLMLKARNTRDQFTRNQPPPERTTGPRWSRREDYSQDYEEDAS